jgi:TP901 family phage tail tape measure protein
MGRILDLLLRVNNRRLKSDLRASQKDIKSFGKETQGTLRNAFSAGVGSFAGFASIGGLGALGKGVLDNEEQLTRIGIQAGYSKEELDDMRKVAIQTGRDFGLSRSKVQEAAEAIINLEGAAGFTVEKMQVLSKASAATGAELKDLAGISFALKNAFGVKEAKEMEGALSAVINAGKNGSVPLNEMGLVLQQIAVKFKNVSFAGKEGAADLSAAIQVARKSFGSAGEVGTGLKAFIDQLDQASPKLAGFGVKVFKVGKNGKQELRPLRDILDQIQNKGLTDKRFQLTQVFGSSEAREFLRALIANRQEFENLASSARKANDVTEDAAKFLNSDPGRLKVAIANARADLEAMFTPERITMFVDVVQNQLVPALDFALDHAKEIALAFGAIKLGGMLSSLGKAAISVAGLTKSAGGLGAVFGKAGISAGGTLMSLLKWAGPIGIAGAALWGVYEAISSSVGESKKLTAEQLKQADIAGKLGEVTQFDPTGKASAEKQRAHALREEAKAANDLLFSETLLDKIAKERQRTFQVRGVGGMEDRTYGSLTDVEVARSSELVETFRKQAGVLTEEEFAELEGLLKKSGVFAGDLRAGSRGVAAEAEAARLEAQAAARQALEKLRFGREGFSAEGIDVGALAAQAGLSGDAADAFAQTFLREAGGDSSSRIVANELKNRRGKRVGTDLGLERSRLTVGEDGKIVRSTERVNPLSFEGVQALLGAGGSAIQGLGQSMAEQEAARSQETARAMADALASSAFGETVEMAFVAAMRQLSISVDGNPVFSAVQNAQAGTREPAR